MSKFMRESSPGKSLPRPGGPPAEEFIRAARAAIALLVALGSAGAAELLALALDLLEVRRVRRELDVALQGVEGDLVLADELRCAVDAELRGGAIRARGVLRGLLEIRERSLVRRDCLLI